MTKLLKEPTVESKPHGKFLTFGLLDKLGFQISPKRKSNIRKLLYPNITILSLSSNVPTDCDHWTQAKTSLKHQIYQTIVIYHSNALSQFTLALHMTWRLTHSYTTLCMHHTWHFRDQLLSPHMLYFTGHPEHEHYY